MNREKAKTSTCVIKRGTARRLAFIGVVALLCVSLKTPGYAQDFPYYYENPDSYGGDPVLGISEMSPYPQTGVLPQFGGDAGLNGSQLFDANIPPMLFLDAPIRNLPPSVQYPSEIENVPLLQSSEGQYRILGDVTNAIPIGNSQFDSIPVLENIGSGRKASLPNLQIPKTEKEFIERVDALKKRFSKLPLAIQSSTPGRLLRYSLIGGADETFLASELSRKTTESGETISETALKPMYALGALCWNYPCANRRLMREIEGRPVPSVGFGFQSQRGEFLATLAFAHIDRDYEIRVDGNIFTVKDLVAWEKYACSRQANLSLVAIGLTYYSQDPDETWNNAAGETWSLARILEQESLRPIDWETAESVNKLLAFSFLHARLKSSIYAEESQLKEALNRTGVFLAAVKSRVWNMFGDSALSDALFFKKDAKLASPYMIVYVNGKLLRWLALVSSQEEMKSDKMKRAMFELCGRVDQLFNSVENLEVLSATDEESLGTAMQTLIIYRNRIASTAP